MHSERRQLIQLDLLQQLEAAQELPGTLALMRPHKWAHGPMGQLELAEICLERHGADWIWSASINSRNGAAQGYRPAAKWGKFAPTRAAALERAADEVRAAMHRAEVDEQERMAEWLGRVLAGGG